MALLPTKEKDDTLMRLMEGEDGQLGMDVYSRFTQQRAAGNPVTQLPRRTAAELMAAAETLGEKRQREEAREAAAEKVRREHLAAVARERHLDSIAGRELELCAKVEDLIATKQPKSYDLAVQHLVDLRDLASRQGSETDFAPSSRRPLQRPFNQTDVHRASSKQRDVNVAREKTRSEKGTAGAQNLLVKKTPAAGVLDRFAAEEAITVLRLLLNKHPELCPVAEQIATEIVSSPSIEDIAGDVHCRITSIDLDALNGRAGSHSWGYVEPDQAACDLLGESVEDLVEDMRRKAELGLGSAAEGVCAGIVAGLYQARATESDGALGWAPDFPGEEADYVVAEFIGACHRKARTAAREHLLEMLATRAPEWVATLQRAADRSIKE